MEGLRGSRSCEVQCWGARHRDASVFRRCRTHARLSPSFEFFPSSRENCWIANNSLSFRIPRFSFTSVLQPRSVSRSLSFARVSLVRQSPPRVTSYARFCSCAFLSRLFTSPRFAIHSFCVRSNFRSPIWSALLVARDVTRRDEPATARVNPRE